MKNNTLDFGKFDTKEVKVESYKDFDISIFRDVFEDALNSVEEMIDHIRSDDRDGKNEVNNIIAFTGERGTGKTTAMVSFVNYLKKDIRNDNIWRKDSVAKEYDFHCVPLIDPSKLTADENIITIVVAYIYESIKEIAHKEAIFSRDTTSGFMEKLKSGVRKCQEIYNVVCVKYTSFSKNIEQNPDSVETFSEIAKATRVRELIQELVDTYLDILSGDNGNKRSILIIPIDDLDTNIKNAYTLAEDLRSCFMISKVIIMMAVKLEQLNDVIQLKFCEDFKNLSAEGQRMDSSAETMATKYLEKLIAYDRRIAMPSMFFQSLSDYTIVIRTDRTKATQENSVQTGKYRCSALTRNSEGNQDKVETPLVEYVLGLLYQKTGIILVVNEQNTHEFIPRNLRTLHQLLQTLETQENISLKKITEWRNIEDNAEDNDKVREDLLAEQQKLLANLEKMYNFLLDNSTSGDMPKELVEILRDLGQQPVDAMNAFLVRNVCSALGSSSVGEYIRKNPVIVNFAALNVHPNLVTMGDVLYFLNELEQAGAEVGIRQFVMAVKMIYSITIIRLLFAQGTKPQYLETYLLLGSTICNPAIQLLPGHRGNQSYEWMPRVKGEKVVVETGDGFFTLDGRRVNIENIEQSLKWNIISVPTAVKLSFYVLGYHRMKRTEEFRQMDPHVYEHGDYPLVKYRRSVAEDINSALLAFHWMSFVSRILIPKKTVDAMLHYIESSILVGQREYKELMVQIENWTKKNVCAVPIYSMDILNELIYNMQEKRFEYDDGTAKDRKMHGYICFMDSLRVSLEVVIKRTYILEEDKQEAIDCLNGCPVLFETEKEKTVEIERELKWLNE